MGNGAGGAGADGLTGGDGDSGNPAGDGGAGGNGGGSAGLCLMIAPTISYSGTVTGRFIKISGTDAHKFLRGIYEN